MLPVGWLVMISVGGRLQVEAVISMLRATMNDDGSIGMTLLLLRSGWPLDQSPADRLGIDTGVR
jgi:hypothetical protein